MRRAFLVLILLLAAALIPAQTARVVSDPNIVLQWNASTMPDGSPPPAGDSVAYLVYMASYPGTAWSALSTVSALELAIALPAEGAYHFAVIARRTTPAGIVTLSPAAVSSVSGTPAPWYVVYAIALAAPTDLRLK